MAVSGLKVNVPEIVPMRLPRCPTKCDKEDGNTKLNCKRTWPNSKFRE